jgi:lipoate-protein ligase A
LDWGRYADWLLVLLRELGLEGTREGNRITVRGRKVSGLAARVSPRAVFVHGTLLVSTDLARLRAHLTVPERQRKALPPPRGLHVLSRPFPETTLAEEREPAPTMAAVRERGEALLAERFGPGGQVRSACPFRREVEGSVRGQGSPRKDPAGGVEDPFRG